MTKLLRFLVCSALCFCMIFSCVQPTLAALGTVTKLSAKNVTSESVTLSWNKVSGAVLYQLYRRAADETSWTLIKNTGSLAYKDEAAPVGVASYYKIVARNGDVKSDIKTTTSTRVVRAK